MRGSVQGLTGTEQLAGEAVIQETRAAGVRSMQDHHRLSRGRADGSVMQAHFGKYFAGLKVKVADGPIAFDGSGITGSMGDTRKHKAREQKASEYVRLHGRSSSLRLWDRPPGCG